MTSRLISPATRIHRMVLNSLAVLFAACAGVPRVGTSTNLLPTDEVGEGQIRWPAQYTPAEADFYVHNEIDVQASPEIVWGILVNAADWPLWYDGARNVRVMQPTGSTLAQEGVFAWQTMGLDFESRVIEYVPNTRLSWESRKAAIQGYHTWLIVPTATGCKVITDESQHGFLTLMQKIFIPHKLSRLHDKWLRLLKTKAESMPQTNAPPVAPSGGV